MSVELATAYISIVPSAKGMAASLEQQMSGAGASAGKKAGTTFAKGFATATAAVGAAVFLKGVFSETQEAQKVAGQTNAVIKSTGNVANVSAKQMSDLANEISKTAGIDDELVQSGENLLRTFTNVRGVDLFSRTTKDAVDLGAAMHTGPEAAALLLGKALQDPEKGLTRLTRAGVTFTEQQKDQIATMAQAGDIAGAQGVILAEVEKEFGGSAAATATEADKARVSYKNMQESLGQALAPAFDLATHAAGGAASAFGAQPTVLIQSEAAAVLAAGGYVKLVKPLIEGGKKALDFAKSMDKVTAATNVAQGIAVAGGFVLLSKMLNDADKAANRFTADLLVGIGDDPKAQAEALRGAIAGLQDQAGKGIRLDVTDGVALFSDNGAKKANHNLRDVQDQLHTVETQIADTGTRADIMGLTTFSATEKADIITRRFGDSAKGTAAAIRDEANATKEAHQANKDMLASTTEQIDKDVALRSATRAATDAIAAYNDNQKAVAGNSDEENQRRAQAAETAIEDARSYQQAVRGYADALHQEEAAERAIETAERSRADAIKTLSTAEKTLATDTAHNVDLVKEMAEAIDAANRSLVDLKRTASRDKISVSEARIRVEEAAKAAAEGPSDPTDSNAQQKLDDAAALAKLDYADAVDRAAASTDAANKAQADGVAKSPQVLAVQDQIAANAAKIATDQDAVTRASQGVADANQGVSDAEYAAMGAHQATIDAYGSIKDAANKSRDDQLTAASNIAGMQDAAKIKSGELRDAVVTDLGAVADAANDWGLGLAGVNAWLTTLTTGLAPDSPLVTEIDALLKKTTPVAIPVSAFGIPTGATGSAGAGTGSGSGTVRLPAADPNPAPFYATRPDGGSGPTHNQRSGDRGGTTITGPVTVNLHTQAKTSREIANDTAKLLMNGLPRG